LVVFLDRHIFLNVPHHHSEGFSYEESIEKFRVTPKPPL
jgi:hypothetical protein